jgi:integrase
MPDFIENHLKKLDSISATALYFTILTGVRTSEALHARAGEFDVKEKVWNIPGIRMKKKKAFSVPLSQKAWDCVAASVEYLQPDDYIFSRNGKKPFCASAMLECLQGIKGFENFTVHGFRASFRSWAYDKTNFPRDLVEACLAHETGTSTEVAYKRTDALERRRKVMQSWDQYINTPPRENNVVNLRG